MKKIFSFVLFITMLMGVTSCSSNWSTEKKQAYAFTLLKRQFLSHPEKLGKIQVVIVDKDWKSGFDTISPTEAKKLMIYPSPQMIEITVPFNEYESDYSLSVSYYKDGEITANISHSLYELRKGYDQNLYEKTGEGRFQYFALVGRQSYPYAQGKQQGFFIFRQMPDDEFENLELEALQKALKIVKQISLAKSDA